MFKCYDDDRHRVPRDKHKNFNDFSMIFQDKIPNFHDNSERQERGKHNTTC